MKDYDEACRDIRQYSGMVYCSKGISCWGFSLLGDFFYSTCASHETFLEHLHQSGCLDYVTSYQGDRRRPLLLSDKAGFLWVADYLWKDKQPDIVILMGPFLLEPCSYDTVKKSIDALDENIKTKVNLLKEMINVPVVDLSVIQQYAVMLHFTLTEEHLQGENIEFQGYGKPKPEEEDEDLVSTRNYQQSHFREQQILHYVREGNGNISEIMSGPKDGPLTGYYSERSDLRSEKNTVIIFTALCARAAIEGGLSPAKAKRMENEYINQVEECDTTTQLMNVNLKMLGDFIHHVHECKMTQSQSLAVRNCKDYIQRNLTHEIRLENLAKETGYSEYYLTKKFYKETGIRLNDYIKDARIELAKVWLTTTDKTIEEISDEMQFTTRNYFSKIFRDKEGMSPVTYRMNHH